MKDTTKRKLNQRISDALATIGEGGEFAEQAELLLDVLGYTSERKPLEKEGDLRESIKQNHTKTKSDQLLVNESTTVKIIFQITDEEVQKEQQGSLLEDEESFKGGNSESFIFSFAELKGESYNRTDLANMTRAVNRIYAGIPSVVLFRYADKLSIGLIGRRPHKYKPDKDVLLSVSLIKDINLANPHRAHVEILTQLSLMFCIERMAPPHNFDGLLRAWLATLDIKELNDRFYDELSGWFRWAKKKTRFPVGLKLEEHIMRLLVRILFVWFIKEKGLVAEQLFNTADIKGLLKEFNTTTESDSYYRAILQNLFFATLNTEIKKRDFSSGKRKTYRNFNLYRYEDQMENPGELKVLFDRTPFINGGLFDCLDDFEGTKEGGRRIDCFSDIEHVHRSVSVPDHLFFAKSPAKGKPKGLIELLKSYKFTVEENTPIEQDVALDPELLGKVFEKLLDEIGGNKKDENQSHRGDTGSYYTRREVVDYMVNEVLIAKLTSLGIEEDRLDYLLDYASDYDDAGAFFGATEKRKLVDAIARLRILDPAGGSGAFPMGVLSKLNLVLDRLDPQNKEWKAIQIDLATEKSRETFEGETDESVREDQLAAINRSFQSHHKNGFGRKLYLIQNCIFGVDLQPIACQIAKLRFFISLAIEQNSNDRPQENYGIEPLPNLETHFVAADTLITQNITGHQTKLQSEEAHRLQRKLADNRERYFSAKTRRAKLKIKKENDELREELTQELIQIGVSNDVAKRVANWGPYNQNARADWFDPGYMFGVQDGFDIVIGNPPYIQLQRDVGKLTEKYESERYESLARRGDIYILFYERGHKLLATDGYLCYITSHQWLYAGYGEKLRTYLSDEARPLKLIDLGFKVFEANVDVNILLIGKQPIEGSKLDALTVDKLEELEVGAKGESINIPKGGNAWRIPAVNATNDEELLKEKVEEIGTPLKEWDVKVCRGITTGRNPAFVITGDKRRELLAQCSNELELQRTKAIIKPLVRGRNLDRYSINWQGEYVIGTFPALELNIKKYPTLEAHLLSFRRHSGVELLDECRNEERVQHKWFETHNTIKNHIEFEKEKLVWSKIVSSPQFAYDEDGIYPLDTTFIMTTSQGNLRYLCGVLNSKLGWYIFKKYYVGGSLGLKGYEYRKQYLERFPIPPVMDVNVHLASEIENLVDYITAAKKQDTSLDTSKQEQKIDKLVYKLYEFDEAKIRMVETMVKSWEEARRSTQKHKKSNR